MNQKERLVEVLKKAPLCNKAFDLQYSDSTIEKIADYLLEQGVIVPPVKVGSKVYIVAEITQKIIECTVIGYWKCECTCSVITDHGTIYGLSFDKTVFLDREDAEKALGKLQASYEQVKGGGEE